MDTNFDEKQAFADLREILNYMNKFANHYYAEMKKAQEFNAENAPCITNLQAELENKNKEIVDLTKKIEYLEEKTLTQAEDFKSHLKEYDNYNVKLIRELEEKKVSLASKENEYDEKLKELNNKKNELNAERAEFENERRKLESDKEKLDDYESLREKAQKFDGEQQILKQQINELNEKLNTANNSAKEIQNLKKEVEKWKNRAENLQGQFDDDFENKTGQSNGDENNNQQV